MVSDPTDFVTREVMRTALRKTEEQIGAALTTEIATRYRTNFSVMVPISEAIDEITGVGKWT